MLCHPLHGCVVIGPGLFQPMGKNFNVWRSIGSPYQKSCRSRTDPTHSPNQAFHVLLSFINSTQVCSIGLDAGASGLVFSGMASGRLIPTPARLRLSRDGG
jgi:hypothetical protein